MRRRGEPPAKFVDEARLAKAGLADDLDELSVAGSCTLPALDEQSEIVLAPDKPRLHSRASAPPPAAGCHDTVKNRRTRTAFDSAWACVFDDKQARDLSPHRGRH